MTRQERHILDNRERKVVDHLRDCLPQAETFRLVSAYFSIYGYELLQDELGKVEDVRFLFGDPKSVGDIDPGSKEAKSFALGDDNIQPNHSLKQKYLAKQCAEWVEKPGIQIRSIKKSNFLHGKMYLSETPGGNTAVVGSSNFTKRGLGGSANPNLEINLAVDDKATCMELRDWFEKVWGDRQLTEDVKQKVLDELNRIGKDHAPELIYYKTLFELFKEEIERRKEAEGNLQDVQLKDTKIWHALYGFQKDGAKSAIHRLRQHNGCILADSVGLGKTWTALAIIKYFELRNERVLVLCPKKLHENWSLYPSHTAQTNNPFIEDRFGYTLLAHTDLSRDKGWSGGIDLENVNWGNFDLVVIDESHNFRNATRSRRREDGTIDKRKSRYERLLDDIIRQGAKTKVLMLSATPVNTSLLDLRNQIYLMTERHADTFQDTLGISDINSLLKRAQKAFKAWEDEAGSSGKRNKDELLERLGADFFRLLGGVSISRSRRHIKEFYASDIKQFGRFPKRQKPENHHPPTDRLGKLSYDAISDQIDGFGLSIYTPSEYLTDKQRLQELEEEKQKRNFNQKDRERFLIGMMKTNFLKRLESSAHSLALTLERTIGKIDELLEKMKRYEEQQGIQGLADILPDEDDEDDEFVINHARDPYRLSELDIPRWREDLQGDREVLQKAHDAVAAIGPARDGKLAMIKERIRQRAQNPTTYQDGTPNRKILVFTTFKDTAEYLYENLSDLAGELGLNMAMVAGDATDTTVGANNFQAILTNFAPVARQRGDNDPATDIDLLIATDCISEGQNLQDCDTVLNYDIHWNPVRLIQRFGRIDRIGSRSKAVQMINYWPTDNMEKYLRLENRVHARMALADAAASGDDNPLEEETQSGIQQELKFRDEQVKRIRAETVDLDELSDGITMSDFTLDHFLDQLLRYLERNRDELEATPTGAYAISDGNDENSAQPGVIFFLRHRNPSTERQAKTATPIPPFYAVYIHDNGNIRHGCANARQVLNVFESCATGRTEPLKDLCARFDRETQHGNDMERYEKLIGKVVDHIRDAHQGTQVSAIGIGGDRNAKITPRSKAPTKMDDFELVTWLVIFAKDHRPDQLSWRT